MKTADVVIIGAGGAGLTAAIYTSRANLKTIVLEREVPGGQIATTDLVANYPGFPDGILGPDFSKKTEQQAKNFGTEFLQEEALSIEKKENRFFIKTANEPIESKTIILATGASFRQLGVEGETKLTGRGVSYCATCDGAFFKGKEVVVVGGGDSACQEGEFLTRYITKLTIIHRRNELRASYALQQIVKSNPKINFIWDTTVTKIQGDNKVESIQLKNVKTGAESPMKTDGVFIYIGHDPSSQYVKDFVKMDDHGYVLTDEKMQTSVAGVYACGEIRKGAVRQLVSCCGEGCAAALEVIEYVGKNK
jgi:thioredoxin reductase (NADPH)